jgi:hypothetical protein
LTLLAGSQIGKYVVQRKLADGGMAEILLASSFGPERLEKQVIIQRSRPGLAGDPAFIKMELTVAPAGEVFIDGKSRGQQAGMVKYDLPSGDRQLDVKERPTGGRRQFRFRPIR